MSYIQAKRMPHPRWKPDEEAGDRPIDARATAQKIGKAFNSASGTAWALGALLVGAASAGAAYALRRQPTARRKSRNRANSARRRAATA